MSLDNATTNRQTQANAPNSTYPCVRTAMKSVKNCLELTFRNADSFVLYAHDCFILAKTSTDSDASTVGRVLHRVIPQVPKHLLNAGSIGQDQG